MSGFTGAALLRLWQKRSFVLSGLDPAVRREWSTWAVPSGRRRGSRRRTSRGILSPPVPALSQKRNPLEGQQRAKKKNQNQLYFHCVWNRMMMKKRSNLQATNAELVDVALSSWPRSGSLRIDLNVVRTSTMARAISALSTTDLLECLPSNRKCFNVIVSSIDRVNSLVNVDVFYFQTE